MFILATRSRIFHFNFLLRRPLIKMTEALPLIAVVGSTGTGKSRLSIELASAVRDQLGFINSPWKSAKIINADAMQAYKGLELVTNKVTQAEMNGVEHTLFDFRELDQEYVVTEWVADAIAEIASAHSEKRLPIVVGGTTYWVQHLLFANRLASLEDSTYESSNSSSVYASLAELPTSLRQLFDNLPPRGDDVDETTAFDLHTILSHLDPPTASRWHWRDTRKVLRSLNIIRESNKTVQDTYGDQLDPLARYPTIVFWLYIDSNDLNPMLDARIDKMVQLGIKDEIEVMRNAISGAKSKGQMTGLNQAIGYKEFEAYLDDPARPQREFDRGVEQMKVATRQYATRQVKWLKSRLLPAIVASENVHIVLLNIRDVASWQQDILEPSLEHLKNFLIGQPPAEAEQGTLLWDFMQETQSSSHGSERRKIRCDVCTSDPRRPVLLDERTEWDVHRKSRTHRRKENKDSRKEAQLRKREEVRLQRVALRGGIDSPIEKSE
ncbi:unnamed protein product [Rhizoctonia solani]|uniref:tRNA dimethylallyltransferase n=1 Tax=Rhizoctonia solani TaxID=456999 RepID=A0A8H3HD54_9AGAM|nr:unnamed protein product [Rhizoctonia solani]